MKQNKFWHAHFRRDVYESLSPKSQSISFFARTAVAATLMPTPTPTTTFSASVITTLQPSLFASTWKRELYFVLCFVLKFILLLSLLREKNVGVLC